MLVAGYDLDMTYITDRILAMSFPAERMRAMYRNPLWQVKSVLEMSHRGHYKVLLCVFYSVLWCILLSVLCVCMCLILDLYRSITYA